MENNQQITADTNTTTLSTGFTKAKNILIRQIVNRITAGESITDIANGLNKSRNFVYDLLNTKNAQRIIDRAYIQASALSPKAVRIVEEALELEVSDPELKLKQSDRAINILYGLGVLKKQTKEQGLTVPVTDLKGILQGVVKGIMTDKIEAEYEVVDNVKPAEEQTPPK